MGAVLFRVKCSKCGRLLLEFERGNTTEEVKMQSYRATLKPDKLAHKIGIAKCETCGGETEFDAKYLPRLQA